MKIALCIKRDLPGFRGEAHLFSVDPPVEFEQMELREGWTIVSREKVSTGYVVVSGIDAPYSGPETYIFPADETGKILDWLELPGSFQGEINIYRALTNAGYEVKGFLQ